MAQASSVRVAVLSPELLGTYGDAGNTLALTHRLGLRGIAADLVEVAAGTPVPESCDVYLLGGSEDGPQEYVAEWLSSGALTHAVEQGAVVVGVCSGLQLLGHSFPGLDGRPLAGLGLLPCHTVRPDAVDQRAVGHVVVTPLAWPDLPDIVGFENHQGRTQLEPGAMPLGLCRRGYGNDRTAAPDQRMDGAVNGRVVGTYLHGPVLALNPLLTDTILAGVVGPLPAVEDPALSRVQDARRRRLVPDRRRWPIGRRWVRPSQRGGPGSL
jgi:lipid II isoglutaminyl synthase (glutamine-hydrolysing)